jgi:two-component system sensor histidine kinase RegB
MAFDEALKQMIDNVLDNALEASPDWVQLEAEVENGILVLSVLDRGPGFTQAMLVNYGKPYHSTKGRPGGGLGLFLVVNVARTLGGTVAVTNRSEGGAKVTLTLPLKAIALANE